MRPHKNHISRIILLLFISISFIGCKTQTTYIPVKETENEYISKIERDSIHLLDSIFIDRWRSNDTVYLTKEKFKYLYRDKIRIDTMTRDSIIQVPYPVKGDTIYIEKEKELSWLEKTQIYTGRAILILAIGYLAIRYRTKIFSLLRKLFI